MGLTSLDGFPSLPSLRKLGLSENKISGGLQNLISSGATNLRSLILANNRIASLTELEPLRQLRHLSSLDLLDCPVCSTPGFDKAVFKMLDELKYLNNFDRDGTGQSALGRGEEAGGGRGSGGLLQGGGMWWEGDGARGEGDWGRPGWGLQEGGGQYQEKAVFKTTCPAAHGVLLSLTPLGIA